MCFLLLQELGACPLPPLAGRVLLLQPKHTTAANVTMHDKVLQLMLMDIITGIGSGKKGRK